MSTPLEVTAAPDLLLALTLLPHSSNPADEPLDVKAVIDTGCTHYMTLPADLAERFAVTEFQEHDGVTLGLDAPATPARQTTVPLRCPLWPGDLAVPVLVLDGFKDILIGMRFLGSNWALRRQGDTATFDGGDQIPAGILPVEELE